MNEVDNVYTELLREQLAFLKALNSGRVSLRKCGQSYVVEVSDTPQSVPIGRRPGD